MNLERVNLILTGVLLVVVIDDLFLKPARKKAIEDAYTTGLIVGGVIEIMQQKKPEGEKA